MARVTLDSLPDAINEVLNEYQDMTVRATHEIVQKVARDGAKAINSSAASSMDSKRYKSSWTMQSQNSRLGAEAEIYSRMPGLPHLLEHGHAVRGGGRNKGQRVHISPVANQIEQSLIRDFEVTL